MIKKIVLLGITLTAIILFFIVGRTIRLDYIETKNLTIDPIIFANLKDGTYTGTYEGSQYAWRKNKVQVTVLNGKVNKIELLSSAEEKPEEFTTRLYNEVIEKQSLQVDVISGETLTSKVYLKAIENALSDSEN